MEKENNYIVLCAMYDKVTGVYSTPLAFDNVNVAKRWFIHYLKNANLMAEPTDFELYLVGAYSCNSACFSIPQNPEFLMKGGVIDE